MTGDPLVVVEKGEITILRLDSPPMNLVTVAMTMELDAALASIETDASIRALIVTGTGERAFSAGSDVKEFESLRGRVGEGKLVFENAVYSRLAKLPMATVAAVQADALGGGLELAMCCDLRVADERARLGLPEVRLGVMPGSGGTQRLPRLVGASRAKEMIFLGQVISAEEAARIGLVNRVTEPGKALQVAVEIASEITSRAPLAVREAKRVIDLAGDLPIEVGLAAELDASERVFNSEDMIEGAAAFLEKRPPRFRGE